MLFGRRKKYGDLADEQLVVSYKQNTDKNIIGEIYERYGHLIYGVCLKYLNNTMEAEDRAMMIFEKLPSKFLKHEIANLKSWLYVLTKNECFMYLRKIKGKYVESLIPEILKDETNNENAEEKELQLEMMETIMLDLKPEQKEVLELFYYKNKSYDEIAEIKNWTNMQVKSAIQNGKRNLRVKMENNNDFKEAGFEQ